MKFKIVMTLISLVVLAGLYVATESSDNTERPQQSDQGLQLQQ